MSLHYLAVKNALSLLIVIMNSSWTLMLLIKLIHLAQGYVNFNLFLRLRFNFVTVIGNLYAHFYCLFTIEKSHNHSSIIDTIILNQHFNWLSRPSKINICDDSAKILKWMRWVLNLSGFKKKSKLFLWWESLSIVTANMPNDNCFFIGFKRGKSRNSNT